MKLSFFIALKHILLNKQSTIPQKLLIKCKKMNSIYVLLHFTERQAHFTVLEKKFG